MCMKYPLKTVNIYITCILQITIQDKILQWKYWFSFLFGSNAISLKGILSEHYIKLKMCSLIKANLHTHYIKEIRNANIS